MQRRQSHRKNSSREIFVEQDRKKRRIHSNSIFNQLRLNDKINSQDCIFDEQSSKPCTNRKLYQGSKQKLLHRNSFQSLTSHGFKEQQAEKAKENNEPSKFLLFDKNQKKLPLLKRKVKNQHKVQNKIVGHINTKLKEINLISKTFDKVNRLFTISGTEDGEYKLKPTPTENILRQFQKKLSLRKNHITERKNSLKRNAKMEYRYKAPNSHLRCATQVSDDLRPYEGLWLEDAQKMKNYISGGYFDQKEDYSNICDIDAFKKLKSNFQTFEGICDKITHDRENPLAKISTVQTLETPNLIEVVYMMGKQAEKETLFR